MPACPSIRVYGNITCSFLFKEEWQKQRVGGLMAISDHNLPYPTYFGTLCPQTHCLGWLPHPNWRHRVGKSAKAGVKKAPIFQCSVACYCEHPFFQGNCAWAEILSRLSLSHKGMMLRIAKYAFFRVLLSANWTKEPQTGCIFNTLLQPLQGPLSDIAHLDCVGTVDPPGKMYMHSLCRFSPEPLTIF